MTLENFDVLDIIQQQTLIHNQGMFIRTRLIDKYLCDIYSYDSFYVMLFRFFNQKGIIKSRCFENLVNIENYIDSLERSQH